MKQMKQLSLKCQKEQSIGNKDILNLTEYFEDVNLYMNGYYKDLYIYDIINKHLPFLSEDCREDLVYNYMKTRFDRYEG